MTLIEMVVAIVIISLGIAGLMLTFTQATRASADPVVNKQMQAIAEELLEEITAKPFAENPNAVPSACARDTFNDVRDYAGYSAAAICATDGTPIPALAGYAVSVKVSVASLVDVTGALKIEVMVTHGSQALKMTGWRTDYAS